ncbi:hypothetical protein [Synechococcus sp. PCC 7336]|uniref:hypothetical protein n=1 Tax=Synechococcus sp. PCC 7336 TaxID=195250 RepID=UPI00034BD262|nr:hypothetical protein [Synechococcus sp. PCC 7336]
MTPVAIRQFWRTIDSLDWSGLPRQDDDQLVPILLDACKRQPDLDQLEPSALNSYITNRLPLIREIASSF